jgi:hypothetical protein
MKVHTRKFLKNVYDQFDGPSKEALIKILEADGHQIVSSEEDYYADIVSVKDGITYYNEAEQKSSWKSDWPSSWAEVRVPGRKRRLVQKYSDQLENLYFYVFNNTYDKAWKIKGTQMKDETIRQAYGRNIPDGETFYHIPYPEAELVTL